MPASTPRPRLPLAVHMLLPTVMAGAIASWPSTGAAQALITYTTVTGKQYYGEIASVSRRGIVMSRDGKEGVIPMKRDTKLTVRGVGDRGFLRPGAFVTVTGTLTSKNTMTGGRFDVHVRPQLTARPQERQVRSNDPQLTVTGRLLSVRPFVVQATDMVSLVTVANDGFGTPAPPVANLKLQVTLDDPEAEQVSLILGSTANLISPGDRVAVFIEDRTQRARWVSVTKAEPLDSAAAKGKGTATGKMADEADMNEEKKETPAAPAGKAPETPDEGTGKE